MLSNENENRAKQLLAEWRLTHEVNFAWRCVVICTAICFMLLVSDGWLFGNMAEIYRPFRILALSLLILHAIHFQIIKKYWPRFLPFMVSFSVLVPFILFNLISHLLLVYPQIQPEIMFHGNIISLVLTVLHLNRYPRWQLIVQSTSLVAVSLVILNGDSGVGYAKILIFIHGLLVIANIELRRQFMGSLVDRTLFEEKVKEQGRSAVAVQALMLPSDEQRTWKNWKCGYVYEACEQLAGDWLYFWECDGKLHVFLGDVVGKGTQAALVGAAIISCLNQAKKRQSTFEEAILDLNECLIEMFRFGFTTTLAGLEICEQTKTARYLNAGAPGWFLLGEDSVSLLFAPHSPLGVKKTLDLKISTTALPKSCTLVGFTDGVIETAREMNKVKKLLTTLTQAPGVEIAHALLNMEREHTRKDDRTLVYLQTGDE